MFLDKDMENRYTRLAFVGLALVIALLYDYFIWDNEFGLGLLMFVLSYLGLFTILILKVKQKRQPWAMLLIIPILLMATSTVLYNNKMIAYGVPIFILILSLVYGILYTLENSNKIRFSFLGIPILHSIDLPFVKWAAMYRDLFRWREDPKKDIVRKAMIGFSIALPILIVFGWLFAQADAVFAEFVKKVLDIEPIDVWRLFRTLVITLFAGSLFYVVASRAHSLVERTRVPRNLDSVVVSIVLALVNILFAVFLFFQFKYLFGGAEFVLEGNITFAEYARKGFFQLCWVVGLAAVMLLAIYRSFVTHGRSWSVTILQSVLIGQVIVVAASALKRMNLYQSEFGLTVMRLHVEWFIYFIIVLLVFAGVSLIARLTFRHFYYTALILGVVALTILISTNVDYMVAKENVRRFVDDQKSMDVRYINELSMDVLPAIEPLYKKENFERLTVANQLELKQMIKDGHFIASQYSSWKDLNFGVLKGQASLLKFDIKTTELIEPIVRKEENYRALFKEIEQSGSADCQLYTLALANDYSRVCAQYSISEQTYFSVLDRPNNLYSALDEFGTLDTDKKQLARFFVYKVNVDNERFFINDLVIRKEYDLDIKKGSYVRSNAFGSGSYGREEFPGPYYYGHDFIHYPNNTYILTKDGALIESFYNQRELHLHKIVVDKEGAISLSYEGLIEE